MLFYSDSPIVVTRSYLNKQYDGITTLVLLKGINGEQICSIQKYFTHLEPSLPLAIDVAIKLNDFITPIKNA